MTRLAHSREAHQCVDIGPVKSTSKSTTSSAAYPCGTRHERRCRVSREVPLQNSSTISAKSCSRSMIRTRVRPSLTASEQAALAHVKAAACSDSARSPAAILRCPPEYGVQRGHRFDHYDRRRCDTQALGHLGCRVKSASAVPTTGFHAEAEERLANHQLLAAEESSLRDELAVHHGPVRRLLSSK